MREYSLTKKLIFSLIPTVILLFVVLLSAEAYVRLTSTYGYITPAILRTMNPQYEPSVFSRPIFPQREQIVIRSETTPLYINEKGYRGHNFSVKKPQEEIRIIIYGGSSVFDAPMPEGKDWPHRVETKLRAMGFTNVEVINAGVPGQTSADSVARLFAEGHMFAPDYVVLYDSWNDLKYFSSKKPLLRTFQPNRGERDPRENYQNILDRWLCEISQVYVRLRDRYYNWKFRIGPEGSMPEGQYSAEVDELAFNQYKLNIEMFVDLARNIGAVPILMTEAHLVAGDNDAKQRSRIGYGTVALTHEAISDALVKIDDIIRRVAKNKKAILIDASSDLTGKDELFVDHVHLTDKGSEEVAKLTAQQISRILKERLSPSTYASHGG